MPTFLVKTEPGEYSYHDLARDKKTTWTGVKNPAALAALRTIRKGDEIFIYHTADEKQIVGFARAVSNPYADPKQPGTTEKGELRFAVIDLAPVRRLKTPVTLAQIKSDPRFATFALVKQSRLSVMAVAPELRAAIVALSGAETTSPPTPPPPASAPPRARTPRRRRRA